MKRQVLSTLIAVTSLMSSAKATLAQSMMSIPIPGQGTRTLGDEACFVKFNAGIKFMNNHQYAEGAAKFKECIALNQKMIEAYINYAICFEQQGKFQEALIVLDKAHELQPKLADILLQRGSCYQQLGR